MLPATPGTDVAGASRSRLAFGLLIFMLFALPGCATDAPSGSVSLSSWQKQLEQYVWDQTNGDPDVLRDMSWDDIHHGFAIFSDPLPQRSTDAIGLLVDHRKIDQRPYFIFLFTLLRDRVPEEIRPVALNVEKGRFYWSVGESDGNSLARYRAHSDGQTFPAPDDDFDAAISGERITITHRQSGASWWLDLDRAARGPLLLQPKSSAPSAH